MKSFKICIRFTTHVLSYYTSCPDPTLTLLYGIFPWILNVGIVGLKLSIINYICRTKRSNFKTYGLYFLIIVKYCLDLWGVLETNVNNTQVVYSIQALKLYHSNNTFRVVHLWIWMHCNACTNFIYTLKNNSWMQAIFNFRIIPKSDTFKFFYLNQSNRLHL